MALLNPDLKSHIADVPGIIMVDELDMHLHPKWQWNVIQALRNTFPNVQFIAATHSPIIISSCKDETLIRSIKHMRLYMIKRLTVWILMKHCPCIRIAGQWLRMLKICSSVFITVLIMMSLKARKHIYSSSSTSWGRII